MTYILFTYLIGLIISGFKAIKKYPFPPIDYDSFEWHDKKVDIVIQRRMGYCLAWPYHFCTWALTNFRNPALVFVWGVLSAFALAPVLVFAIFVLVVLAFIRYLFVRNYPAR